MDAFVTATGFDEDNLLLALLAKKRGIEDVIAKVSRDIYTEMVAEMGVDMALNPLDITASNILRIMQGSKRILSSQMIQGQAEVTEIYAEAHMKLVGKPIRSIHLPDGVLIAAIHRGRDVIIPNGNTEIRVGDRVTIMCLLSEIADLEHLITTKGRNDFLR
jgi:trk system potassium uptake protein TrkA